MSAALAGRTAVVTGGGRGIGEAIAVALAGAGVARIALLARTSAQLEDAAVRVRAAGAEPVVLAADLVEVGALASLAADILERLGQVDVLVNNAATVQPLGPVTRLHPGAVLDAFRLNVVAPSSLAGLLVPPMVDRGWGRVVNISSGAAGNAANAIGSSVYAATKSALEAHTLALAGELRGTGVTVNAYRPGVVDSPMQQWVREQDPEQIGSELHERFLQAHRSGALLPPERAAGALVARLSGDESGRIWDVHD